MIDLTTCTDKCFADSFGTCRVLIRTAKNCNATCPFYKPKGCKDWVRMTAGDKVLLLTPEEYEELTSPFWKGVKNVLE